MEFDISASLACLHCFNSVSPVSQKCLKSVSKFFFALKSSQLPEHKEGLFSNKNISINFLSEGGTKGGHPEEQENQTL